MFENITYKKKLFGLSVLIIVLFLAANKRSFKVTKASYDNYKELEAKLEDINSSTINLNKIQADILLLDNLIGKQGVSPEEAQQSILDFMTEYDYVNIVNLEEVHFASGNGFNIYTNQLVLEGEFNNLIKVVYAFEKEFSLSKVVSISFNKEKNYNSRREELKVNIMFQNYEKSI